LVYSYPHFLQRSNRSTLDGRPEPPQSCPLVETIGKTALVEPNLPMDALADEILGYALVIPPVVMGIEGTTSGGAFAWIGGESSSFRWRRLTESWQEWKWCWDPAKWVFASQNGNGDLLRAGGGIRDNWGPDSVSCPT
jgi:hypothetical protein